jgi:8-oxo-dGTP pyrophosphatase MutT (NUDIX family)
MSGEREDGRLERRWPRWQDGDRAGAHNPWQRLASAGIYENRWIRVREDQVVRPDRQRGIYGVVEVKSVATGVVPVDAEGWTYLVGQFRYTLDTYSWEIPEGGGAIDLPPRDSAARELREETGIRAAGWHYLGTVHTSNCITDEVGYLYLARDLTFGDSEPDADEQLEVRRLPLAEAVRLALDGAITDSMSVLGLLKAERWLRGERFVDPDGVGSQGCLPAASSG